MSSLIQNLYHRYEHKWAVPEFVDQGPKTLREIEIDLLKYCFEKKYFSKPPICREKCSKRSPKKEENVEHHEGRSLFHSYEHASHSRSVPSGMGYPLHVDETKTISHHHTSFSTQHHSHPEENRAIIRLSLEEICNEFQEIYRMLEEQNEERMNEALKQLFEKSEGAEFVKGYLKSFNDGTIDQVKTRLELFPKLIEFGFVDKWDFNTSYGECLFDLWNDASDFPGIESNYAKIFLEMVFRGKCFFKDLYIHPALKSHEDKGLILETYNCVILEMEKLVTNEYPVSYFTYEKYLTISVGTYEKDSRA